MRFVACVGVGLLVGPGVAWGQLAPQLYVGAAAVALAPPTALSSTRVGPLGVVGLQFSPRWAIQSGLQAHWRRDEFSFDQYSLSSQQVLWQVPLLARYTFTSTPDSRLLVDGLVGGSWLHSRSHVAYSYLDNAVVVSEERSSTYNGAAFRIGPQLRYQLGKAAALTGGLPILLALSGGGSLADRLALELQVGG